MTPNPQRKRSATRRAKDRSRITNCARFLPDVDGRSARGRRFRDLVEVYLEKTGGRQQDLCRQLATLVTRTSPPAWCEARPSAPRTCSY
jgi:hypothetical protein